MAGLHSHKLDFEILDTGNTKTLVFMDSSEYMAEPESPLLEVIMPGYSKYLLTEVEAKVLNTFNSSTMGFNKVLNQTDLVDLPDGVWQFKYKICPYTYVFKTKKHLRVTQLIIKLHELLRNKNLCVCSTQDDKDFGFLFTRISILIEGAKAEVNRDSDLSSEYYQLADKLIQKQLDKFCKNCK